MYKYSSCMLNMRKVNTTEELACKVCGTTEGFVDPCEFCGDPVCSKHAHFLSVRQSSIHGTGTKTRRICADCKPTKSV